STTPNPLCGLHLFAREPLPFTARNTAERSGFSQKRSASHRKKIAFLQSVGCFSILPGLCAAFATRLKRGRPGQRRAKSLVAPLGRSRFCLWQHNVAEFSRVLISRRGSGTDIKVGDLHLQHFTVVAPAFLQRTRLFRARLARHTTARFK